MRGNQTQLRQRLARDESSAPAARSDRGQRFGLCRARRERQFHPEKRAAARRIADGNFPAVQLNEFLRDGQSQTRAAKPARRMALCLPEALEDGFAQIGGNARARILEFDYSAVRLGAQGAADLPAGRRELERVGQKIQKDALQFFGVGLGDHGTRRQDRQFDLLFTGQRFEVGGGRAQQFHQVHRGKLNRHFPGVELGDVKQVSDVLKQRARVAIHDFKSAALFLGQAAVRQNLFRRTQDQGQRRAQFVADVGEELCLELVEFLEPGVERFQFAVG